VKVNLGSGLAVAKGWINVDGSLNSLIASWPAFFQGVFYNMSGAKRYYKREEYLSILRENVFAHHDLSCGAPFADDSVDFIYSSHFFEHLYKRDAINLLKECHRVLKPGGVIRITVPDLAHAFSLYQSGRKDETLMQYFFVDDDESSLARHKYMYDDELLREALSTAGFRDTTRRAYREGATPDLDALDNRPDDTLFMEAVK